MQTSSEENAAKLQTSSQLLWRSNRLELFVLSLCWRVASPREQSAVKHDRPKALPSIALELNHK